MPHMPDVLARLPSLQYLRLSGSHAPGEKLLRRFTGQLTRLELKIPSSDPPAVADIERMLPGLRKLVVCAHETSASDKYRHLKIHDLSLL